MSGTFTGVANPDQLRVLTEASELYCRSAGIEHGTVEHKNAAALIVTLFTSGAATAD